MRRDELYGSDNSDDEASGADVMDTALRTQLQEQIARSLGLATDELSTSHLATDVDASSKRTEKGPPGLDPVESEDYQAKESGDEFEFQLFSTSEPTKGKSAMRSRPCRQPSSPRVP